MAACTPEGRAAPWPASPDPVKPSAGQALWHAVERHAATLYRRAVSSGAVDQFDPAVDAARQRRGSGDPRRPSSAARWSASSASRWLRPIRLRPHRSARRRRWPPARAARPARSPAAHRAASWCPRAGTAPRSPDATTIYRKPAAAGRRLGGGPTEADLEMLRSADRPRLLRLLRQLAELRARRARYAAIGDARRPVRDARAALDASVLLGDLRQRDEEDIPQINRRPVHVEVMQDFVHVTVRFQAVFPARPPEQAAPLPS